MAGKKNYVNQCQFVARGSLYASARYDFKYFFAELEQIFEPVYGHNAGGV